MPKIQLLDDKTINQIAAGEVVERPASVVKELIENAIDAKASFVSVEIEQAGVGLIRVRDDGSGMDPGDLLRALQRHATSKISSIEDVLDPKSLGFRGEALPSISAVSRLEIVSRPESSSAGYEVRLEGGKIVHQAEVGAPVGTTVAVRDLFFNTPARRKFLKSSGRENALVLEVALKAAFSWPAIRFRVSVDAKETFFTPGGALFDAIVAVYGTEFARQLVSIDVSHDEFELSGFVGRASLSRSARNEQFFSVNDRSVRDGGLRWALEQAYGGTLASRRYPVAFLQLRMPADAVDVNVHPAKTEVRFRDDRKVRSFVLKAVSSAVSETVTLGSESTSAFTGSTTYVVGAGSKGAASGTSKGAPWATSESGSMYEFAPSLLDTVREQSAKSDIEIATLEPVGRVLGTYIVAEHPAGLVLIDQHAAHERINYEIIHEAMSRKKPITQPLLAPVTIEIGPVQRAVMREYADAIEKMGFLIEEFGGSSVIVRSEVSIGGVRVSFSDVLDNLCLERPISREEQWPGQWLATSLAACMASIKANQYLDTTAQRALIKRLAECETPLKCPHGRPTLILYPKEEIERRFGRR